MKGLSKIKELLSKNPPRVLVSGFFMVILTGAFLLMMPFSSKTGEVTNFLDCLFTATSAVCVTGLVTLSTATHWSTVGHVIIILLIQIGGLGFMTVATLVAMILGKKITLKERLIIHEQMNTVSLSGMVKLIRYVLASTFIIESVGAILLAFKFVPQFGAKGIWYSVFHSISAFCNAGFDILGDYSLSDYIGSPLIILTISFLIILGGIGFSVYMDVTTNKLRVRSYAMHSKFVLSITAALLLSGTILILLLEFGNPGTLGNEPWGTKFLGAFFQSVTTRTAGFFSIDQVKMTDATAAVSIMLMFIGGSPAGTAGGIKTSTFGLLVLTTLAEIRNTADIEVFRKRIAIETLRRALAIAVISMLWVATVTLALSVTESKAFINLLFETVSGFGTVGLTRGVTPGLTATGKILIISCMFMGRVGPLTLIFAFAKQEKRKHYREQLGHIIVG